jgi:hypothetical protein
VQDDVQLYVNRFSLREDYLVKQRKQTAQKRVLLYRSNLKLVI